jgi:hypothetical protein
MKVIDCKLGDDVRDTITGYVGCVVSKTEWLNGCWRIGVQSRELKDGKPIDNCVFDVEQLEVVKAAKKEMPVERTGGDRPNAGARPSSPSR